MPRYLNYYDNLAQSDIRKMKENLVKWVKNNPNAVLLFDSTIIPVIFRKMSEQQVCGYTETENILVIENIKIQWYNIGCRKAILKSITETDTNVTIYTPPDSWSESEIWYQFK